MKSVIIQQQDFMRHCIGKGLSRHDCVSAWVKAINAGLVQRLSNVRKISEHDYGDILYTDVMRRLHPDKPARLVRKARRY